MNYLCSYLNNWKYNLMWQDLKHAVMLKGSGVQNQDSSKTIKKIYVAHIQINSLKCTQRTGIVQ